MIIFLLICIRPDDSFKESNYFQFNLLVGAAITLTDATLNISKIEFIEHNLARLEVESVILLISNSTLLLNVNIFLRAPFISFSIFLYRTLFTKQIAIYFYGQKKAVIFNFSIAISEITQICIFIVLEQKWM